jgi:cytochrome c-type biogenesis protein
LDITGVNFISVLAAFAFGALSFLSPCVLPLLPGYLSMMSGYSATELSGGTASTRRMLRVTLLFVAGFTAVFVALGAGASFLLRNEETFTSVAGWLVIGFGLFIAVTAVWTPRFMMPLLRERRVEVRPSRLGSWAPPLMGAAFGFGWTPCIGPTLGAILALAASQESTTVAQGMFLLFVYSLGLGVPFVLAGIGMNKALGLFGWLRRHLRPITVVSGALLALFGVLMVTGRLIELNRWFQENLPEWLWNV